MRKIRLLLVALVMLCGLAAAPAAPPKTVAHAPQGSWPIRADVTALTQEQRRKDRESFEVVWKTVRDAHPDPRFGGVNWQGVREELRPRMEKVESRDEARAIMQEMLNRLGHSHVGIVPASLYEDLPGGPAGVRRRAVPGFDVRMVGDEAMVVSVTAGLPAARSGVRPGWLVRKINGEELAPTLARIRKAVTRAPDALAEQAALVQAQLRGDEGKEVAVTFRDGSGKEVTVAIPRARPRGNRVQFGQTPPVYVHFEARKLDNDIAYFSLSNFYDPQRVMPAFARAVRENPNARGFILDLRGNPGGLIAMTQGLGSWFIDQPDRKLGTMIGRTNSVDLHLNPRAATYRGRLAILVDEFSASSSEFLAGGLQDLGRARVFGRPTTGRALPSRLLRLPNGDRLQYVDADYVSAAGRRLEGNGVQPDEVVALDRQALLAGRDPTLEAARQWLRSRP
jgi:carboxyl-terminal processing protease